MASLRNRSYLQTRMKSSQFNFVDAFTAFRDWEARCPDEAQSFVQGLGKAGQSCEAPYLSEGYTPVIQRLTPDSHLHIIESHNASHESAPSHGLVVELNLESRSYNLSPFFRTMSPRPRVFVSYSWDDYARKAWVSSWESNCGAAALTLALITGKHPDRFPFSRRSVPIGP